MVVGRAGYSLFMLVGQSNRTKLIQLANHTLLTSVLYISHHYSYNIAYFMVGGDYQLKSTVARENAKSEPLTCITPARNTPRHLVLTLLIFSY